MIYSVEPLISTLNIASSSSIKIGFQLVVQRLSIARAYSRR